MEEELQREPSVVRKLRKYTACVQNIHTLCLREVVPINPSVSELFVKLAVLFLAILRESVWILSVLSALDCRRSPGLSVFERRGLCAAVARGPAAFCGEQDVTPSVAAGADVRFSGFCCPVAHLSSRLQELHMFCILSSHFCRISVAAVLQDVL